METLMHMTNFLSRRIRPVAVVVATACSVWLSGCTSKRPATTSDPAPLGNSATITGNVHGGQQPIYNAVVRLYASGTSGYGSGSTLLATSVNTNTSGVFSFTKLGTTGGVINSALPTWQCPASGNPQIYITAIG